MHCVSVKKRIYCDYQTLFAFVWDIKRWASFWSPIYGISVIYDDKFHQEFSMEVDWREIKTEVKTVRFRENGNIFFFSPKPPPPTTCHQGIWNFNPLRSGEIELEAIRWFNFPMQESNFEYDQKINEFSISFHQRLNKLLQQIKEICEN